MNRKPHIEDTKEGGGRGAKNRNETKSKRTHVLARTARDVREGPRRLELQRRVVVPLQEHHEPRHDARVDDLLYGRVLLYREEAPELRRALRLEGGIAPHDPHDHLGEVLELVPPGGSGAGCARGRAARVHAGDGPCFRREFGLGRG